MKILKRREKSKLLRGLSYLDNRLILRDSDKRLLLNLEKGFDGEKRLDDKIKQYLTNQAIVLNDLLLVSKGNTFQVDTLIISSEAVYVYEVKNYKGNYVMNSERFTTVKGIELSNPKLQLARMLSCLSSLFQEWGFEYKIEANILFINPHFTLYHAQVQDPIILPTQIHTHLLKVNDNGNQLNKKHHYLANKLVQLHKDEVPYQKQLPEYSFHALKKGIVCKGCGSFNIAINQRTCYCSECSKSDWVDDLIMQNIKEFMFLFPEENMTVKTIYDWCGKTVRIRRIRKILKNNFTAVGTTNGTYYE